MDTLPCWAASLRGAQTIVHTFRCLSCDQSTQLFPSSAQAESDPEGYKKFILEQKELAEEEAKQDREAASLAPSAGFVVKTTTVIKGYGRGKKVFVNVCSHPAIGRPQVSLVDEET